MRTTLVAISIRILAGALLSAPAPAFAQEEPIIVATVPFDFTVGHQHLPAGKYVVRPEYDNPSIVWIERADGREAAVALTIAVAESNAPTTPSLIFETRDNQHVLARLVDADDTQREIIRNNSHSAPRSRKNATVAPSE
jgi:hypothetical protein